MSKADISHRLRELHAKWSMSGKGPEILVEAANEIDRLKRNMRDQFDALCAMRNDLNELLPIQSIEADLMKGPETSVFCEAVVNAVKAHIAKIGASA